METCIIPAAFSGRRFFFAFIYSALFCVLFANPSTLKAESFTDDMGRKVDVRPSPSRIVSLAPHLTELLFTLGLGENVVGVTRYSDFPEEARNIEKVGSYVKLDLERIVSLSPQLVLATADGNPKAVVDKLTEVGIPVYVINTEGIDDIYGNIRSIGEVTGKSVEAHDVAMRLEKRINSIVEKVKGLEKPRIFIQLGIDPLYTAGKNTFVDDLIRLAGGRNIAGDIGIKYPVYSREELLNRAPQIIFSTIMGSEAAVDTENFWKRWPSIPAVSNGRIYHVDPDLLNRPSIRIADGLEIIARKIQPQVFEEPEKKTEEIAR